MKTNLILKTLAALAIVPAASCSHSDPVSTDTIPIATYNLYTPADPEAESYVTSAVYQFQRDNIARKLVLVGDGLTWNNAKQAFTTSPGSYQAGYTADGGEIMTFDNLTGHLSTNSAIEVKASGYTTNRHVLYYDSTIVPDISGSFSYTEMPALVMKVTVGDLYTIRTFNRETFFGGTTETAFQMQGQDQSFENDKIIYRTVIDIEKNTADVVIYNAKFAEQQPKTLTIILKGLKVEWGRESYSISGSNIIPDVLEGGAATPNPSYVFNDFELHTTDSELVGAEATFTVRGLYEGRFKGSYIRPVSSGK